MAYSYIARQPIMDRQLNVYGYELLFRNSEQNVFPKINPDEATSKLLMQQHLIGDIQKVCLGRMAFINFHTKTLLHQFPVFLSKQDIWIELLETVDISPNLLLACQKTSKLGYRIALDDHDFSSRWEQIIPFVNLVKVDIQDQGLDGLKARVQPFHDAGIPLLAECVETKEEYEICRELGFTYFQGYFFERPQIIKNKALQPQQLVVLELLQAVYQQDFDFKKIARIISADLSLTYSLLKFVNSPAFHKQGKIRDLNHALTFMGERELKKYIALVALAQLGDDQPEELVLKSMTRAQFMSSLERLSTGQNKDNGAFMCGLLSLIDLVLNMPMTEILARLPLASEINDALLHRKGQFGRWLKLLESYEQADWAALDQQVRDCYLSDTDVKQCYLEASGWCGDLVGAA